jgi:hypothetical protein
VISPLKPRESRPPSFRTKLLVAMMLVVSVVTTLGLLFAQHKVAANVKRSLQLEFQNQLDVLHAAQEVRSAALAELSRVLAGKSRIHAALEDNALDLLYPRTGRRREPPDRFFAQDFIVFSMRKAG